MRKNNFIYRPHRFQKPVRSFSFILILFYVFYGNAQNSIVKTIDSDSISNIEIDGNQIFNISVTATKVDDIKMVSTLDGEYQNEFQVVDRIKNGVLHLKLEHLSFSDIADDKRNAHKVIAATLQLEIPEGLSLNIASDIGSVDVEGDFKSIFIELQRGHCKIIGSATNAIINTIDGDINVFTVNAKVNASSNNGEVAIEDFEGNQSQWDLKSINGDITVGRE